MQISYSSQPKAKVMLQDELDEDLLQSDKDLLQLDEVLLQFMLLPQQCHPLSPLAAYFHCFALKPAIT